MHPNSISRALGDASSKDSWRRVPYANVVERELAKGLPSIDADWVAANFTDAEARTPAQASKLTLSDELIDELQEADVVVLTAPVYNFSVPSVLKAWIDHVCRAGRTFRYTANGPQGLLTDKPVYLVMASGGVPFGSPVDFASGYLKQVLRFIGIEDVRLIGAEGVASDAELAKQRALSVLDEWLPDPVGQVA